MNRIHEIDIPQIVSIRVYPVDEMKLCELLRRHRKMVGLKNLQISEMLNVPLTMVEHWFRADRYFAIPTPEMWPHIKEILDITDTEFDTAIMTFREEIGKFEKGERHYIPDGICPTNLWK